MKNIKRIEKTTTVKKFKAKLNSDNLHVFEQIQFL